MSHILTSQEIEDFKTESNELIDSAEKSLLAIENGESPALHYDAIFRVFHSLKGAAGMMELVDFQQLMHVTESELISLKGQEAWSKESLDSFLNSLDGARKFLKSLKPGTSPEIVKPEGIESHGQVVNHDLSGLQDFLVECEERLNQASQVLEKAKQENRLTPLDVDSVYRDVHSLKGAAGLYQFEPMERLCHEIESALENVRSRELELTARVALSLIDALDLVAKMVEKIRTFEEINYGEETAQCLLELCSLLEKEGTAQTPPPTAAHEKQSTAHGATRDDMSSVRVNVALLDHMMTLMGELVLVRNQVLQFSNNSADQAFINLGKRLNVVASDLQIEVMKTRMQPFSTILAKFNRVVRDLSKEMGKKIELEIKGAETELDRTLIEAVKDPLMHLIRNSCDHGIELPKERLKKNKRETGTIGIKAYHEGGQVVIEVTDDGKGIDHQRVLAKAIEKKLVSRDQAQNMKDREIYDLLFAPGFSTATQVTNVSGRGVGMDVVKSNIEKIGGSIEIESVSDKRSSFRLRIPLTLAIVPAMIVACEGERYAIPQVRLLELVRTDQSVSDRRIEFLQGKPVLRLRGEILSLVFLHEALGLESPSIAETAPVVVVSTGKLRFGLIVSEIQDTADIVVKPLPSFLKNLSIYSGATVMGDGSVTSILDIEGIASSMSLEEGQNKIEDDSMSKNQWGEMQDYLVFRLGPEMTHFAAILNLINRIEEFSKESLEKSGHQKVVRYRGGLMPLFSVAEILGLESQSSSSDVVRVLVTQRRGYTIGLVVSEILDVLTTDEDPEIQMVDRPGIMGHLVKGEKLVVLVDVLHLLDICLQKFLGVEPAEKRELSKIHRVEGKKILVVEDSPLFRKKIARVLSEAGYEVETAQDGLDAWSRFQKTVKEQNQPWFAVVSDIEMPKMTGWELLSKLQQSGKLGNTLVVAVSSKDSAEYKEKGRSLGFHKYLSKFDPEELLFELEACDPEAKGVA